MQTFLRGLQYLKGVQEGLKARVAAGDEFTSLDRGKLQFFENLKAATDAVVARKLALFGSGLFDESSTVELSEFHAWTIRADLPIATGWPSRTDGTTERWSWGRHTTPLLEALEAAAKAHWRRVDEGGQYDPADPSSASGNDKVAAWLQERFPVVSNETAQVMARILRDPALPAGRPRER